MFKRELSVDFDPLAALEKVADLPGVSLLFSGMQAYGLGRYSILAACPWKTFSYKDGFVETEVSGKVEKRRLDFFEALEEIIPDISNRSPTDLPFYGGPIGYVSYDAGRYVETIESSRSDGFDARFQCYHGGIVFDHVEDRVYATSDTTEGFDELAVIIERIQKIESPFVKSFSLTSPLQSNIEREVYCDSVSRIREFIRTGEVYQVNLSQQFSAKCSGSPLDLFERLSMNNKSPYSAYMNFGDEQIVSSSPERFLTIDGTKIRTRPIKGTRPLGSSESETKELERELAKSEKDRSELLMIVDLERNDLGKVCRPGSVVVENIFALERYATLIHQTAEVSGELESGVGVLDCFKALFPGGSITGAPKIRAMEIIAQLEKGCRGVYTGSIGYVSRCGKVDFNIAIRTIRVANEELSFHVGAGIVWDSNPDSEYEETLLKGRALIEALNNDYVS